MWLRKRRAVTLLITLSVIATMLALVGVLFGYLETARQKAEYKSATLQASLLRQDLQVLLQKYLKNPSKETLQHFYSSPLVISEEQGKFDLMAHCKPLLGRIPISWLGNDENPKMLQAHQLARELFDSLCEKAELKDPFRLYEMIRLTLRGTLPSFGEAGWLSTFPGLLGPNTFKRILDDYRFIADDPNVYRVPWKDYFLMNTFPVKPRGLDREFLSPELVAYLYGQDLGYVRSNYTRGEIENFLQNNGLEEEAAQYRWLFAQKPPLAFQCTVLYSFREKQYNLTFDYRNGRIEHFAIQAY
jgi:hypothetical protein